MNVSGQFRSGDSIVVKFERALHKKNFECGRAAAAAAFVVVSVLYLE